jgi:hypothetical protein
MPEPTAPQNQITQFKLAAAIGAVGGSIGLAGAIAEIARSVASVHPSEMWIKDLIWAASGATQATLAILLWRGNGGAFKAFAQASVVLSVLFLTRSMDFLALANLVPLVLFATAASSEQAPRPAPVEPMRRNRRDRY